MDRDHKVHTTSRRRKRGSLSRAEILEAAIYIIQNDGVDALSMRNIAKRLRCSVASPYTHFKNQREIIRELLMTGERTLAEELRQARQKSIDNGGDTLEQLEALAYAYWNFSQGNRSLHRVMIHHEGLAMQRELQPLIPASYKIFLRTIRQGVLSGQIIYPRASYPSIARTIWAWIYGVIIMDLNGMQSRNANNPHPIEEGIHFFKILLRRGEGPIDNMNLRLKNFLKR